MGLRLHTLPGSEVPSPRPHGARGHGVAGPQLELHDLPGRGGAAGFPPPGGRGGRRVPCTRDRRNGTAAGRNRKEAESGPVKGVCVFPFGSKHVSFRGP